ncbi:hypothetical protein NECAME_16000 [Necator americanus]|uniref:Serpin domain-containing protein n=1 Tax=Necator americanus TaxID=51031 RepID=W2TZA1_NECAM|nr:hypothetical protein NECAME_16000 [Necator americanus]ETN86994.1 hypothetical protein NECAME_16000 [Necator americanus]
MLSTKDTVKDASSLIINCIYFYGRWWHKFDKSSSENGTAPLPSRIKFGLEELRKKLNGTTIKMVFSQIE